MIPPCRVLSPRPNPYFSRLALHATIPPIFSFLPTCVGLWRENPIRENSPTMTDESDTDDVVELAKELRDEYSEEYASMGRVD